MSDRYAAASGLADVADAIRRSTALNVAMSITPAGSSEDDMLATADRMVAWLNPPQDPSAPQSFVPPGWSGNQG